MNYNRLISIIIPTKNRQSCALHTVQSILKIDSNLIEVIVHDNSDDESLKLNLEKTKDSRLIYKHNKQQINMVENFNQALSLATGEYVCFIGDDDGVMSEIIPLTIWMKKNNIDAVAPSLELSYTWPDVEIKGLIESVAGGVLNVDNFSGSLKKIDPYSNLVKLTKNGGQGYLDLNLVKAYHGIVHKDLFRKIKEKTGYYFGGLSPDIYSAVALSVYAKTVYSLNFPVTINGVSAKSASADSAHKKHIGELKDAPLLNSKNNYDWSELVPAFYSVPTIWADSFLHALNNFAPELIEKFGFVKLASYCIKEDPKYRKYTIDLMKKKYPNKLQFYFASLQVWFYYYTRNTVYLFKRVKKRLLKNYYRLTRVENVKNIELAVEEVEKIFTEYDKSIHFIL